MKRKKKTKQEIQSEINVINAFGVGMGFTIFFVVLYSILEINIRYFAWIVILALAFIIIKSNILKKKLK